MGEYWNVGLTERKAGTAERVSFWPIIDTMQEMNDSAFSQVALI
jgi:hypothetical protein